MSPDPVTATRQFGAFPGTILTFRLESKDACFRFMNKLQLICRSTNVCDNRTLILHPASTIYCDFSPEVRENIGVPDTLLRFSTGIENYEDLISDIQQALI
jgi:O-acetylhomoserine (thiol)-lyase